MGFAALNAAAHQGKQNRVRETLEAQESRIADTYAAGLRLAEEGRRSEALVVFEGLLDETLTHTGGKAASISAASASQLRYLVLRNLASLLAGEDASAPRALTLYAQALMLDDGDSVVWNHMGTLAAELGRWGVARTVFEHGLQRHPKHAVMAEKLAEVQVQLGDWQAAQPALARLLGKDPTHPRALQLQKAGELARAGTILDAPASPFWKRAAAPELPSPQHNEPLVLSVSSPTWSALLHTVTTALTGPRQLQGQNKRQDLQGVEFKLPPEQSSSVLAIESEDGVDIMELDSAPLASQPQHQPEHAEPSVVVGNGSPLADTPGVSATAAEPAQQASVQLMESQLAAEKASNEAGRPPPARVSRRLEARRGGHHPDTDNAGGEEEVNILAELRPFLPHEPPLVDDMTSRAADAPDMVREAKEATRSGVQDAVAEEQAVRAYVASNGRAGSVHAAGLGLLKALPQEHRQHWTRDTAERALALASALGSTWRPEGEIALTLAEMGLDAADAVAEGRAPLLPGQLRIMQQVGSDSMPASSERKAKAALKRKGAEHAAVAKLLACSEENLGHYLMSRILQDSKGLGMTTKFGEPSVRHLWALARTAEMRRNFGMAAKHYAACLRQLQDREAQHQGSEGKFIRLPHFSSGLVISTSAAQAKLNSLRSHQVMEAAKAHYEGGRADLVIAELAPLLLSEAGAAGKGPLSKPKTILEGLQVLQDAAVALKDASCELKCRLVALKWLLPPIPKNVCDDSALHSAPASGPPPAAMGDLQKAFRSIAVEAMADLAEFIGAYSRAGDVAASAAGAAELPGLLQHVLWQAAALLEAAFWSLCGGPAHTAGPSKKTMNAKMTARQSALLAACMGFCAMQQLQLARQPATLNTVALEERMLAKTASYLARRNILDLQRGAFVRLALGRFSHALSVLRGVTPDDEAKEELVLRLNSNLARCLQLLFGVTLPDRNMEWGAAHGEAAENLGLQNRDECIEVWQHLKPYAESLEKDSKALGRLQGVLGAIQKHFKAPPASVLDAWDPAKLLDSMPFNKSDVYSSTNANIIEQLLQQPSELHLAVADDSHAAIHCSLHRLLDIIKPDIDAALKFGDGLSLEDKGAEVTESVASLAAYDLRYNPRSLRSWDSLANTYKEAASNILNEAAQAFSVGEFQEREDLKTRFATYQRRALWASLAARKVAADASMADEAAILDEQIGNILYEELQNAPPFSDQLSVAVQPRTKMVLVQNAAQAYRKAWSGLPDEWLYACYSGKLQAKLGAPPESWLTCMAKAVHLSVLHVGGLVEPFYQLHSLRLKLLLKAQPTLAELQAISRFCSQQSAADKAAAAFSGVVPGGMTQVKCILMDDCIAAMRFCLECDKQYHKASFQIGRALAAQGRNEEAVKQLQSLFSARNRFCINIWEIQGGSQAKSPTASKASAKDTMSGDIDDRLWCRQPGSMSGNGLDETYRKFAAARRKYMLLYFQLLQSTGRLDVLMAGHAFLQSTAWGSPDMMVDLARISLARCVIGAAGRLMQHRTQIVDPSPLQPEQALEEHLQLCFTLYTEHLLGPEAGFSAADTLRSLPDTPQEEQDAVAWALKEGFRLAAQHWVAFLGSSGEIGRLHDLLSALRKHFKMLRAAPEEVQALASLAAADMALAVDRRLTRLGSPPYQPRSSSAASHVSETEDGSSLPRTLAAPDTSSQQPAPAALVAAPAAVASTAPPARLAAPASSAVPAMGTAHHTVVLQRLDLSGALVATLAPHMPQILLHLVPGNDGERRVLQSLLLSGYDLSATLGPHFVQQLKAGVQRNAAACMQLLSAATGQAGYPGSAVAASAALPAVPQVASPSQATAVHVSMAEPPNQSEDTAVLLSDAQTAVGTSASQMQGDIRAKAAAYATQQCVADGSATPDLGLPVRLGAGMGAAAASVTLPAQTASVPEQPQMAEDVAPMSASPAAQGRRAMETSAESREEAFELMRLSRYLHKSGMSRLPEQQDQSLAVKEGLAKIDGNMVRAYVLYLKSAGLESKVGPSIRVVDAATGYEELAKSLKQASPAKAARGARERPGPGASADREEAVDAGTEAGPGQDGEDLPAKRRRRELACS